MAVSRKNTRVSGAQINVGAYVAAAGAGTLADVGALEGGATVTFTKGSEPINADSVPGPLRIVPTDVGIMVKGVMLETTLTLLRKLLSQPAANLTGTAPNESLLVGQPAEEYFQVTIKGEGPSGTNDTHGTETITIWMAELKIDGETTIAKGKAQAYNVTITGCWDTTVTTADKMFKIVDASGA